MMKKRPLRPLFALAAVATAILGLTTKPANAETVLEEQFIYEAGTNIDGHNGGVGFDGEWISTISHGRIYEVQTAGLSFPMLPVAGNSLSRYGSAGRAQAHRLISGDSQTALTGDGTTVWFSVLFQEPSGQYRHTSFLFGTEAFTTGGTPELAASGDGFGFTIQAAPDGASQGNGSINALAFHDGTLPTVVAGTFTPVPQEATNLIVGKINWKASGTPDELFLFNITDLSIGPAEDTAFASITDLDFGQSAFDTIAMWDSNNGIIDEIRFGTTFADVMGVLRCPSKLSATGGEDGVTLTWLNGEEMPTSVQILRDGEEIESAAPVDPPTYTDTDAQPGLIEYELIFTMPGEEACESLTTTWNNCITDVSATRSEAGVKLTWINRGTYDGIEIRCNGNVIEASLDGTVEEYIDTDPPGRGVASYSIVPTNGTCDPATVEVALSGTVFYESFEEPDITAGNRGQPWIGTISGFNVDTVLPGWVGVNRYTYLVDKGINEEGTEQFVNPSGDQVAMVFDYIPVEPQNSSLTTTAESLDEVLSAGTTYLLTFNTASVESYPLEYHVQLLAIDNSNPEFPVETVLGEVKEPIASNDLSANSDYIVFTPDSDNEHLGERVAIRLRKGEGDWHYSICYDNITLRLDPPCPFALNAFGGPDGVTLEWESGEETSVQILRDGEEIESAAPVDPPTYTDTGAQPGLIKYELIFTMPGEETCKPLTLTYHAGITELAGRESEDGEVILTWKNNMGYEGIDITRNGKVIATVDGSEEEYIDSTPPFAGLISYSVVPTEGTSGPATVEIKLCNCYDSGCIPIANPGFEEPDVANEDYLALWDTDGWGFYLGDGGATVEVGAWDVNIGYKGIAPGGENVGYAYATNVGEAGAGFAQILEETLTANSKYTLAVEVGNTDGYQWGGYRVQLLAGGDAQYIDNGDEYADEVAGGELLSEDNTSVDIAPDTFETVTVTYTYDPSEHQHLLGTSLQIRLLSLGEETDFDCVRLKVETTGTAVYFQRGDVNADGTTDISDAICTLSYLFGPEGNPCQTNVAQCMDAADSNDDGKLNIADAIYLLNYQFAAGPALPEPFAKCGVDQSTKNDPLDCKSFPICEELE